MPEPLAYRILSKWQKLPACHEKT